MNPCEKKKPEGGTPAPADEEICRQFEVERSAIHSRMRASNFYADEYALLFSTAEGLEGRDELRLRILRTLLEELEYHRNGEPKEAESAMRARVSDLASECRRWID